jgi:hypothetical protein
MRSLIVAGGLVSALAVSAAAEDTRPAANMTSLSGVIQLMSDVQIRQAGELARKEMAIGKGMSFGRGCLKQYVGEEP